MSETEKMENVVAALEKMHRWRAAFFGLVILLAGFVIGASSMVVFRREQIMPRPVPPEVISERIIGELGHRLSLRPQQRQAIEPVLRKYMQKLHEIRMDARSKIVENLGEMDERISSLLDEHQKQQWHEEFRRLQQALEQGRGPRRGGPPMPPEHPEGRGRMGQGPPREPREPINPPE